MASAGDPLLSNKTVAGELHTSWRLLHACNLACSYCADSSNDDNIILDREKILAIADNILAFPHQAFDIRLCGGEPTLHPFLPDIIRHLLGARKRVSLTLETNGSMDVDFYLRLTGNINPASLKFDIHIQPSEADLENYLILAAALSEHHHPVHIHISHDPAQQARVENFYQAFAQLRRVTPFGLSLRQIENVQYSGQQRKCQANAAAPGPLPGQIPAVLPPAAQQSCKGMYCCLGTKCLRIESNGSFYGSSCDMATQYLRFWEAGKNAAERVAGVVCCAQEICPGGINARLPKFESRREADEWLAQYKKLVSPAQETDAAGFRPPAAAIIASRLRNLQPGPQNQPSPANFPAIPDLTQKYSGAIAQIYASFVDESGRDLFLRAIKCLETGNTRYLLSTNQAALNEKTPRDPSRVGDLEIPCEAQAIEDLLPRLAKCGSALVARRDEAKPFSVIFYAERPLQASREPLQNRPLLSIILHAKNDEKAMRRSLDSIMAQAMPDIEIIIADNEPCDGISRLLEDYAAIYPAPIRFLYLRQPGSILGLANHPHWRLSGKFAAFLEAGDMLAPDFVARGSKMLEEKQADLAFFPIADAGAPYPRPGLPSGDYSGQQAVEKLLENGEILAPGGALFRLDFLENNKNQLKDAGNAAFLLSACQAAGKVIALSEPGYYKAVSEDGNPALIAEFLGTIEGIEAFFEENALDKNCQAYRQGLKKLYSRCKDSFFTQINEARFHKKPGKILTRQNISTVAANKYLLGLILEDYARAWCRSHNLWPRVAAGDLDWRSAASRPQPPSKCAPYADADNPPGLTPALSVIMTNCNAPDLLEASLDSILSQSFSDFELIVVDDCSHDGSYELLQAYADLHPRIRLYRMAARTFTGACRNAALDSAKGDYLIFVESGDLCLPGYFDYALKTIEDAGADLAVFAVSSPAGPNAPGADAASEDKTVSRAKALHEFFVGKIDASPWAKIFRSKTVREHKCRFAENAPHQDALFIFETIFNSKSLVCGNRRVYERQAAHNPAIRPETATWQDIHSVCIFQDKLREALERVYGFESGKFADLAFAAQYLWNIENILLPACQAFLEACGELPLTGGDFQLLQGNPLFLTTLLGGFARLRAQNGAVAPKNPEPPEAGQAWVPEPLVSVIILQSAVAPALCLAGLAAQSLRNLEIIIDESARVEKSPQGEALNLRRIAANGGRQDFANRALREARGKYVLFMENATELPPDFLLSAVALLGQAENSNFVRICRSGKYALARRPGKDLLEDLRQGYPAWPVVFRKEFLTDTAGFLDLPDMDAFLLKVYAGAEEVLELRMPDLAAPNPPVLSASEAAAGLVAINNFLRTNNGVLGSGRREFLAGKLRNLARLCNAENSPETEIAIMQSVLSGPEMVSSLLQDLAKIQGEYGKSMERADIAPKTSPNLLLPVCKGAPARKDPWFSLLVYARNEADEIAECLANIPDDLEDVEIVVVDDFSFDGCEQLCAPLVRQRPGASLWRVPSRGGRNACWNLALRQARGRFVLFMEADERLAPNFIYSMAASARQYPESRVFVCKNGAGGDWPASGPLENGDALARLAKLDDLADAVCLCAREGLAGGLPHGERAGDRLFTLGACATGRGICFADMTAKYRPAENLAPEARPDPETQLAELAIAHEILAKILRPEGNGLLEANGVYGKLLRQIYSGDDLRELLRLLSCADAALLEKCARTALETDYLLVLLAEKYINLLQRV